MTPEIDPSTLTAYALNELNAEDRAKVESHLTDDAIARQTAAEVQAMAAILTTELAQELQCTPSYPMYLPLPPRRRRWATAAIGLAAAAAIAAGVEVYVHRVSHPPTFASISATAKPTSTAAKSTTPILPKQKDPLDQTGSNVLFGDRKADWDANPFLGTQSDNIYTGQASRNTSLNVNKGQVSQSRQTNIYDSRDSISLPTKGETPFVLGTNEAQAAPPSQPFLPTQLPQNQMASNTVVTGTGHSLTPSGFDSRVSGMDSSIGDASLRTYPVALSPARNSIVTGNVSGLNYFHGTDSRVGSGGYNTYSIKSDTADTESYNSITDNPFLPSRHAPLSTFGVDVDTASYSNVRRFIEQGQLPPTDAVRIQDLINYFPYSTTGARPTDADPIAVNVEVADCPWQPAHRLARIALKAKSMADQKRPPSNLVFLIDVSGSMADDNKLPLLKQAIKKLVNRLTPTDRVSIVTYAGNAQMTLEPTACDDASNDKSITGRQRILNAIDGLNADGETNGGDGIQLAYKTAVGGFLKEGVNRVILATDGDFNVGIVDPTQLTTLIEKEATTGVYLTVLGLGMGNVKDATMEKLAEHGKGNYAYLDSLDEADKVLGRQINATLVTVANDVKLQVEFNPRAVAAYRLIGYEDRAMPNKDFNNDQKTAGEMGAGHSVVALYEMIPANAMSAVQPLKYQPAPTPSTNPADHELMTVSVHFQPPQGGDSRKLELPVIDQPEASANASSDFRFTAAVASFGMILRNSPYRGDSTLDQVIDQATAASGEDVGKYRAQFIELAKRAKTLCGK